MYMFMPPLLLSFRDEEAKDDFASSRELFISAAKERKSMDQHCKSLVSKYCALSTMALSCRPGVSRSRKLCAGLCHHLAAHKVGIR